MPSYIVKVAPDIDLYVYWSTIVDAPTAIGSRDELAEWLRQRGYAADDQRFDRADRTGTSSVDGFYV